MRSVFFAALSLKRGFSSSASSSANSLNSFSAAPPTHRQANDLACQSEAGLGGLEYESLSGARFSLRGLFFSILRWRIRFEGMNETSRDSGYFIDSRQKRGLIGSRRFVKTADFSYELE